MSVLPARSLLWAQDVTTVGNYFVPRRRLLILKHSNPVFVIGPIIIIIIVGVIVLFIVMCLSVSSVYFEIVSWFLV